MFFPWFFLCPNLPPPVIGLDPPFDDLIELNSVFGSLISESHPLEVGVGKHSRIGREWGAARFSPQLGSFKAGG